MITIELKIIIYWQSQTNQVLFTRDKRSNWTFENFMRFTTIFWRMWFLHSGKEICNSFFKNFCMKNGIGPDHPQSSSNRSHQQISQKKFDFKNNYWFNHNFRRSPVHFYNYNKKHIFRLRWFLIFYFIWIKLMIKKNNQETFETAIEKTKYEEWQFS